MRRLRSLSRVPPWGGNAPGVLIDYELFKIRPAFSPFYLNNYELFKIRPLPRGNIISMVHYSPNWGGPRPGAGRPRQKTPSRCISINLPEELIERLDRQADRQRISRSAMITHYLYQAIGSAPSQPKPTPDSSNPTQKGESKLGSLG